MKTLEAINSMLTESGKTKTELARSLGRKRQSIYNMYRKNTDVRCLTLAAMAEVMGYELLLRKGDIELKIDGR